MNSIKLLAIAVAVIYLNGCSTTTTSSKKTEGSPNTASQPSEQFAQRVAKEDAAEKLILGRPNPNLPSGVVEIAALKSSLHEYLVGSWVSKGRDEEEIFERAGRIYPDIRQDYGLRVSSGLTPKSAQIALMPSIYDRIKSSALPANVRLGHVIKPTMYDPKNGLGDRYEEKTQRVVMAGYRTVMHMPWTSKFSEKKSAGESTSPYSVVMGAFKTFKGKQTVGTGQIYLPFVDDKTFPLSSEAMYQLKKEALATRKPVEALISIGSDGGFMILGEPSCDAEKGDISAKLVCSFQKTEQSIAPARLVTTASPLAKNRQ